MSLSLPFKSHISSSPNSPITIFLHGFLGSHKNFTPLARHTFQSLNHTTYTLDFRNHGLAPHIFPMDYTTLTHDIEDFCTQHGLKKVNIVGYSMGAKVGMSLALSNPGMVAKLVCIDNAPVEKDIGEEFRGYVARLKELERWCGKFGDADVKNWKVEALEKLKSSSGTGGVISGNFALYLLDNLRFKKSVGVRAKIPLENFGEDVLVELGKFPKFKEPVETESLFIRALKSGFVDGEQGVGSIERLFPNNEVKDIDDTHHAILVNHYKEMEKLIIEFLK